ncbi:MAG: hypothetical protein CVV30_07650 [Methanomicrobiales archaeon HGW-Methanomicrobiales-1]|jgi:hypothetical protein|nr:MAG: hypothetical protein CVV30_07650 [Methanomicrobiales archaeon HGW-Methanomicrobiales-1]
MSGKTTIFFIGFLFVVAVVISAAYLGGLLLPHASVVSPHISPSSSDLSPIISTHSYPFEKEIITITVPVSDAVYQGAKLTNKEVTIYGNISEEIWIADSYRSMVNDPAQEDLYRALTGEFKKIKESKGLSDDEYLELITLYVQSLRYETLADNPAKFPVETVVDGSGDCDDKSMLLAGLLSHESYRVALLSFGTETHMALGVAADEFLYKNTTYTYIETTNFSFVGIPADTLGGGRSLQSNPVIIPIGNGTKIYTSGEENRSISNAYNHSEQRVRNLEPQIKSLEADLTLRQEKITQLELQMQSLRSSGNIQNYNAQVSVHNGLVSDYNTHLSKYKALFAQYENAVHVHNYILEHNFDRPGVYAYVKQNWSE